MNRIKIWIDTRDSFWFVPLLYSISAIILVLLVNITDTWILSYVDQQLLQPITTEKAVAVWLYGSLVTAILTMTTISFSTIMVVLTTYSAQFSPRTLQDFMRSRVTHQVLGVDCFGFIFAVINLVLVDKQPLITGPILMSAIAIINLAFFVYFIHYSARWIQVNNLVVKIRRDTSKVIHQAYKKEEYKEYQTWDEEEIKRFKQLSKTIVRAPISGYVQFIANNSLVKWSKQHNIILDMQVQMGDYVPAGFPIFYMYSETPGLKIDEKEIKNKIVIGNERTDIADVEFMLQKLVEIALRAISPAINDPHTAINCINRIGTTLSELSNDYKEVYYLADHDENLRILQYPKIFEDYLYKSFYQLIHFAQEDVSIYYSLIEVLYKLALISKPDIKQRVWNFHYFIVDAINWDNLSPLNYEYLFRVYNKLKQACNE
ncbi:MAG TPA: DUF2254 domain-containing protein [Pseudogracilibacillus sp.]|nr:DUF2254 domain-containing protein [Pseudogracilibacillus sp.]